MTDNGTFFEASNGWQFKVDDDGHIVYRFQDENKWSYIGTQVGLGLIEWAQTDVCREA